jgi:hypothetical protein
MIARLVSFSSILLNILSKFGCVKDLDNFKLFIAIFSGKVEISIMGLG